MYYEGFIVENPVNHYLALSGLAKELLEPVRPIAECLQGRLQEVYVGFKKITEIMKHYKTLRENVHTEHNRIQIYGKALRLSTKIGSEE